MASITIIAGSVYGLGQFIAEELETALEDGGHRCEYLEAADAEALLAADTIVAIVSTTGVGDVPDNIEALFNQLTSGSIDLKGKRCLVAALGDSSYVDSYCMGGQKFYGALLDAGCTALAKPLLIDASESSEAEEEVIPWVLKTLTVE